MAPVRSRDGPVVYNISDIKCSVYAHSAKPKVVWDRKLNSRRKFVSTAVYLPIYRQNRSVSSSCNLVCSTRYQLNRALVASWTVNPTPYSSGQFFSSRANARLVCDYPPTGVRRQASCCISWMCGSSSTLGPVPRIFWVCSFHHRPYPSLFTNQKRAHTAIKKPVIVCKQCLSCMCYLHCWVSINGLT